MTALAFTTQVRHEERAHAGKDSVGPVGACAVVVATCRAIVVALSSSVGSASESGEGDRVARKHGIEQGAGVREARIPGRRRADAEGDGAGGGGGGMPTQCEGGEGGNAEGGGGG